MPAADAGAGLDDFATPWHRDAVVAGGVAETSLMGSRSQ